MFSDVDDREDFLVHTHVIEQGRHQVACGDLQGIVDHVLVGPRGVFVMETVSVILQVTSYKLTGKRIFRMAPIHHHFELKGWAEPKVIVRFWIISVILVLVGLATLKVR